MSVYASRTDQVLLGVLWAVRDICDDVSEPKLAGIFGRFQDETGTVLYGPVEGRTRASVAQDLDADLRSLEGRGMISRSDNPHARVTMRGAPVASSLLLPPPFDRLVDIARESVSS
jgi:hypothetical protein